MMLARAQFPERRVEAAISLKVGVGHVDVSELRCGEPPY
jgi:hypothetical protein